MIIIAVTRGARGLFVLALALPLLATLAAQTARAATIHACVKPKSGATRIVSAKAKCHHGEQKLAWSTTGSPGPAGPPGQAGLQGAEGKAGANGAGAVFSAGSGETELEEGEAASLATKTVPPGSYMVWGKTFLFANADKEGIEGTVCYLSDSPGLTNTGGTAGLIDVGEWEGELGKLEPDSFFTASSIPLQATLTSSVTSTLSVNCGTEDTDPGVVVKSYVTQLQALAVTSIG